MHVLILGEGGVGKSYIAEKMKRMGFCVIDEGLELGLSKFVNRRGRKVSYVGGKKWWADHYYVHDARILKRILRKHKTLYVFGLPEQGEAGSRRWDYDLFRMFDRLYYLDAPKALIRGRLLGRADNPFGKQEGELKAVIEGKERYEKRLRGLGFRRIDATLPTSRIIREITSV